MSKHDKPDYVIALKETNLPHIKTYLFNLKVLGLDVNISRGQSINLIFVKVYISDAALEHFSHLYEIGLHNPVTSYFYTSPVFKTPFKSPVNPKEPLQERKLTEAERIMIVNKVLENAKYGDAVEEFGLSRLKKSKRIETAYPLHDGPLTGKEQNTRSVLYRYWSNMKLIHVQQPLDLIFQYYGNEMAFYFAWMEYFNIMLTIPAVLGAVAFLASLMLIGFTEQKYLEDICSNTNPLCAICEGTKGCKFMEIFHYCSFAKWTMVFDNHYTVSFAVFMTFWATLFVIIWRRKESILKLRWSCENDKREIEIRQTYLQTATKFRHNIITGEMEPHKPKLQAMFRYFLSTSCCLLMIVFIFLVVVLNTIIRILVVQACTASNYIFLYSNATVLSIVLSAIIQVCFIKIVEMFYVLIPIKLTKFENPKTQYDFDNSVLYKKYLLAFMNNYVHMMYLAFLKDQLVTVPHNMTFMRKDNCQPVNCIIALCVQLVFILAVKTPMGNLLTQLYIFIKKRWSKSRQQGSSKEIDFSTLPQWEEEYYLEPVHRYTVTNEFCEVVITYGYVSLFSNAFPLAALVVLLNNLIELRSDALKFVKSYRRPVPIEKSGIGAWNGILRSLSYLATAINAFLITFTTDWVSMTVYRLKSKDGSTKGYFNSTLTRYAVADYPGYSSIKSQEKYCFFRGYHNPPESPNMYGTSEPYWKDFTVKMIVVFIFEHVMFLCVTLLAYVIPNEPESVKLQWAMKHENEKETIFKETDQKIKRK